MVTTTPHIKLSCAFTSTRKRLVQQETAAKAVCEYEIKVQSRALNLSAFPGTPEMPTRVTQVAPTTAGRMGNIHLSGKLILTMPILHGVETSARK